MGSTRLENKGYFLALGMKMEKYIALMALSFLTILLSDSPSFAQSSYTPYAITTLPGPAGPGGADGPGSTARFYDVIGTAMDRAGNVYVADSGNNSIRKITPAGIVTTLAGLSGHLGAADGTGSAARFYIPAGLTIDRADNLYVTDWTIHTIRKVTLDGVVTTFAGLAGHPGDVDGAGSEARFYFPSAIAADAAGNLFLVDQAAPVIRKVTPAGVVTTLAALATEIDPQYSIPTPGLPPDYHYFGVAVDNAGNVYVSGAGNNTIQKVTSDGVVSVFAGKLGQWGSANGRGSEARFQFPTGVAVDSNGNLYVGELLNYTIRMVAPSGDVTTLAGWPGAYGSTDASGSEARFFGPRGVALAGSDALIVTDEDSVRRVTLAGDVTTLAGRDNGDSIGGFKGPSGVAADAAGHLYVADAGHNLITELSTATGRVTKLAGSGNGLPGIADGFRTAAGFTAPA